MKLLNNGKIILILCLTLGLAPYFPEPHVIGKLKWVARGANGMKLMDWFDLFFHGFPFVLLLLYFFLRLKRGSIK